MKPKKINGKLSLNKMTISHVGNKEMKNVYGASVVNSCIQTRCEYDPKCIHSHPLSCIPTICKCQDPVTV